MDDVVGKPVSIPNEELSSIHFQQVTPTFTVLQRTSLIQKIFNAIVNGHTNNSCAHVIFNTDKGYKQVDSVILSKNNDWLMLKGGKYIPIQSILNIELFQK